MDFEKIPDEELVMYLFDLVDTVRTYDNPKMDMIKSIVFEIRNRALANLLAQSDLSPGKLHS